MQRPFSIQGRGAPLECGTRDKITHCFAEAIAARYRAVSRIQGMPSGPDIAEGHVRVREATIEIDRIATLLYLHREQHGC